MEDKFGFRYIGEELGSLIEQTTDPSIVKPIPVGKNQEAFYVEANETIKKLNYLFGYLWSHRIVGPPIIQETDVVVYGELEVVLMVEGKEVRITKGQAGGSKIKRFSNDSTEGTYHKGDMLDLGGDIKAAIADSLKKCASEFGVFLDVYMTAPRPRTSRKDRVDSTQLETFYLRAKRVGMDEEEANVWAKEQSKGMDIKALDSSELMTLVGTLIRMEKERRQS